MLKTSEFKRVDSLLGRLARDYFIYAPQKKGEIVKVNEVDDVLAIDWSGETPENSWKDIFLPAQESIFDLSNGIKESKKQYPKIAAVGMNVLDLKALCLFDQVFGPDTYYRRRRSNTLVIGYGEHWPIDYKKFKIFSNNYEEDILEHLSFDIFLAKLKNGNLKIYSGSEKGRDLLESNKLKDYKHIEFAGPVSEQGVEKKIIKLKEAVWNSLNDKLWDELDKICLACGKCSIVCPTCFCFDLKDNSNPDNNCRDRCRGNCFYNDFSLVAGGTKELDTVKKKIFFWYVHKFVRIPQEYGLPGCVGCGRCSRTCPVGIDIGKNIKRILGNNK
jgi:sulfhydrogenase subunit beta (sulfur reductase)